MSRRDEILAAIADVPALPSAVAEVSAMVHREDLVIDDLRRAIEVDPGLTSNLLKMANSAYFGSPRAIASVRDALVRIGLKNVFELIVSAAVAPVAQRPVDGYDLPRGMLWEHAVGIALTAKLLAEAVDKTLPSYLFTAGLLLDIGKIVLGEFVLVDADEVLEKAFTDGLSFEAAEREVLGIDHAEVGAVLLDQWNLPTELVHAARWHHEPDLAEGDRLLVDVMHASDAICMMAGIGAGADGLNYRLATSVVSSLGLSNALVERVIGDLVTEMKQVRASYGSVGMG